MELKETKHIDKCECVYCGHIFNGRNACNADMDETLITCPKCGKNMNVYISCEFLCREIE
jgi:NAD-dependent SIR2 family protein deacetylase